MTPVNDVTLRHLLDPKDYSMYSAYTGGSIPGFYPWRNRMTCSGTGKRQDFPFSCPADTNRQNGKSWRRGMRWKWVRRSCPCR